MSLSTCTTYGTDCFKGRRKAYPVKLTASSAPLKAAMRQASFFSRRNASKELISVCRPKAKRRCAKDGSAPCLAAPCAAPASIPAGAAIPAAASSPAPAFAGRGGVAPAWGVLGAAADGPPGRCGRDSSRLRPAAGFLAADLAARGAVLGLPQPSDPWVESDEASGSAKRRRGLGGASPFAR